MTWPEAVTYSVGLICACIFLCWGVYVFAWDHPTVSTVIHKCCNCKEEPDGETAVQVEI